MKPTILRTEPVKTNSAADRVGHLRLSIACLAITLAQSLVVMLAAFAATAQTTPAATAANAPISTPEVEASIKKVKQGANGARQPDMANQASPNLSALQQAEQYLEDAQPCFDKPKGSAAAARKALVCLQTAWPQLEKQGRSQDNLKARQNLTRAAFWAGEYEQAKKYAQDWLKASVQLEQAPVPSTHNERVTRKWDRGEAIHDANMILGEIALSEGKTKEAGQFLIEAGKVTDGLTLTSYGPDLALANDLLEVGERQAVVTFFEGCHVFWKTGRDSLSRWTKAIQAGQKPDFGPALHFRFKRLQR